jgi:hypothetical protein
MMKTAERDALLDLLQRRFSKHPQRHRDVDWASVRQRLAGSSSALPALAGMERSGGEPDVIGQDPDSGRLTFCDCSTETPAGRRSLCYDAAALDARKQHKPSGSAQEMALSIGIRLLDEAAYRLLQELSEFDLKTSSWVQTPDELRAQGGALFCDRRYGRVFVYHNGAQSYYAARGFRGALEV